MQWQVEYIPNIQFIANGVKLPTKRQLDYSIIVVEF